MSRIVHALFVVLTLPYTFAGKLLTEAPNLTLRFPFPPLLHGLKHDSTDFPGAISSTTSQGRVMEDTGNNSIQGWFDVSLFIIP
jgi:hypothetical protein